MRPLKNMMEYAGIDAVRLEAMEDRLKKDVLAEVCDHLCAYVCMSVYLYVCMCVHARSICISVPVFRLGLCGCVHEFLMYSGASVCVCTYIVVQKHDCFFS